MRLSALVLILVFALLCLSGVDRAAAATHVVINEFDNDPPGDTAILKDEWVELFNPISQAINVSGWQLVTMHGQPVTVTIPAGSVIPAQGYLLIQPGRQWLDDTWEIVVLKDTGGNEIDRTLNATDPHNDERPGQLEQSWQRFPNGQDWALQPRIATKGYSNGGESVTTTTKTSLTSVSTTTAATTTQTTTITHITTSIAEVGAGSGFGFAVIAIGAGVSAAGAGVAVAASGRTYSGVFAYAGYYYCKNHRVPVWSVQGRLWCPVEQRYLRPPGVEGSR